MYQQSNSKYFRVTAYCPEKDICFIMDSNGMFEKLWQFSSFIISKGCQILEVGKDDQFKDINIEKLTELKPDKVILRACAKGKPTYSTTTIDGTEHKTVEIDSKKYIPE